MAEATLPTRSGTWIDRPVSVRWQRAIATHVSWELVGYGLFILFALVLRLWDLGGRAMHHDESLHAYYAWKFFVGQGYHYDPLMHGPFQFEVVPLFYLLFGDNEFSARLLAALLGTALVALPYFLRSHLTRTGALLASLMLAVSPAFVYFSRFIRDDMYLVFFSLLLFIALVRYLESPRPGYLYLAGATAALAVACMEAAYLTLFIFGTFLILEGIREKATGSGGPVMSAVKATSLDTWMTAASIFVVIIVLSYSTFFTNPYGIWDSRVPLLNPSSGHSPLFNPARKDVLGGIFYWQAQHNVQRGGQPWYYYLLLLPLYEQAALVFGLAGLVLAAIRRNLVTTFLAWWAVFGYALYTWAGEKMPWLTVHIALPLILLAGLFVGRVLRSHGKWARLALGSLLALLLALQLHSTFQLNFAHADDPTEMLIYVQSSPDVPRISREIENLAVKTHQGLQMPIGVDANDVGGWPFIWYLRHYSRLTETSTFAGPVCGGQYCPAMVMLSPEYDKYSSQLAGRYVAQRYRWNWWFPEDYKTWFPTSFAAVPLALHGQTPWTTVVGTGRDWSNLWNWLMYRQPFGNRDARWMYLLVRRDLVPGSKYRNPPTSTGVQSAPASSASLSAGLIRTIRDRSGMEGPRGLATDSQGNVWAADPVTHRILRFSKSGRLVGTWGRPGTRPGMFAARDSPQGVAVGANGLIYVADTWNQRIQVFDVQGHFVRAWGGTLGTGHGQFYGPRSVAVGPQGDVYVADTGNRRIQVFSSTGRYLFGWGSSGTASGQFQEPSAVATGPGGEVYVADFWNKRIQKFTAHGRFLKEWQVPDWTAQSYDEPYLGIDRRNGNVFATDPQGVRVLEYTSSGRLVGSWGSATLSLPIGIAVGRAGRVSVSDPTAHQILLFAKPKISRSTARTSGTRCTTAPTSGVIRPGKPGCAG